MGECKIRYDKSRWSKIKQDGETKDKIWYDKSRWDKIKQDGGM